MSESARVSRKVGWYSGRVAGASGKAIHAAYAGDLDYAYAKDENLLRVTWRR